VFPLRQSVFLSLSSRSVRNRIMDFIRRQEIISQATLLRKTKILKYSRHLISKRFQLTLKYQYFMIFFFALKKLKLKILFTNKIQIQLNCRGYNTKRYFMHLTSKRSQITSKHHYFNFFFAFQCLFLL